MPYRTTEVPVGSQFGRLTTVAPVVLRPRSDGRNRAYVEVQCSCGTTKVVAAGNLMSGNSKSCGCLHRERAAEANTTHGHRRGKSRTRLLNTWKGMKDRCLNPNCRAYRWYGGTGVTLAEEWNQFEGFLAWAEVSGYADGLEIDRKDSDGPYAPWNCRWVTKKQNIRSRDRVWDDVLDEALVAYAADRGRSPYDVIEEAVREHLTTKGVI